MPFLEEALSHKIINYSALARKIKKKVEKISLKSVQTGAVIMALKRAYLKNKNKNNILNVLNKSPDMVVKSNLIEYTVADSEFLFDRYRDILEKISNQKKYFFVLTHGVFETTIVVSRDLQPQLDKIFKSEKIIVKITDLSSITIRLTPEVVATPGVYSYILKSLSWEGINVVEVASTYTEFTLFLKESEIDKAFSILQDALAY